MSLQPAITPRPPPRPVLAQRWRVWLLAGRRRLAQPWRSLASLGLLGLALLAAQALVDWAVLQAVWTPDATACEARRGLGACWGMLAEKAPLILWGRYPLEQLWRPLLATLVLLALVLASAWPRCWRPRLVLYWLAGATVFVGLMGGGVAGLPPVPTERWGGLPLTLMVSSLSIALALPLGVLLALGRRSRLPVLRALCTLYIECVRGVPLVAVLFMASFMFPLLLPAGFVPDVLLRVIGGITLFAAAYLAETVRGGLAALDKGQLEAAASLGLSPWQMLRWIALPQALAKVLPGLVNSFISIVKDSSLMAIVSLYELTGSLGLALNGDALWRPYWVEAYLFITLLYFIICAALSRYSQWLERLQSPQPAPSPA